MRRLLLFALCLVAGLVGGCGGGVSVGIGVGGGDEEPIGGWTGSEIRMLFLGNSHTHNHDLPAMVETLVRAARPGRRVEAVVAPGSMFLDERIDHAPSVDLLQQLRWSAVVLQAQRYSSSGTVTHSTTAAEEWVRRARDAAALPVLFPEWPRRGVDESTRIFELHRSIARAEPACVPPIPQAFDIALARHPGLALHEPDGNHASPAGALLAAMVIASTLTGVLPDAWPRLGGIGVDAEAQTQLRDAATVALRTVSPWASCPADRTL